MLIAKDKLYASSIDFLYLLLRKETTISKKLVINHYKYHENHTTFASLNCFVVFSCRSYLFSDLNVFEHSISFLIFILTVMEWNTHKFIYHTDDLFFFVLRKEDDFNSKEEGWMKNFNLDCLMFYRNEV